MAEQALPKVVKEGDFTDPLTASPSPPPPPVTAGGGGVQGERETSPTQRSATDPGLIASGPEEEKGEGEEDEEPFTELEIDLGGPVIITNGELNFIHVLIVYRHVVAVVVIHCFLESKSFTRN